MPGLPDWVGDPARDSVGIRVPDHPATLALLAASGPLAVTSANRSGEAPAADAAAARAMFGTRVAAYLPGVGVETGPLHGGRLHRPGPPGAALRPRGLGGAVSPAEAAERISTRRKWAAIGVATALLTASFWVVLLAFRIWLGDVTVAELEAGAEVPMTTEVAVALIGGFALMAAGFAALALISRRPRPWGAAALAWLLGGALWLGIAFVAGEPDTPMVAGFAAGGVVALRAEAEHTVSKRVIAAVLITGYVYLLLRLALLPGVIVAPLLPLPALAWADALAERRALARPAGEGRAPAPRRPGRRAGRGGAGVGRVAAAPAGLCSGPSPRGARRLAAR